MVAEGEEVMKTQEGPSRVSIVAEAIRQVIALPGGWSFPFRLVPIPVALLRRAASVRGGRSRVAWRIGAIALLVGILVLAQVPAWAGQQTLPADAPNIFDPDVRAHFQPVGVANLRGNPDFPVLLFLNTEEELPRILLLALDARNGKDTWSLTSDPIVLIVVFSDEMTIKGLYVDTGFADQGKASGSYAAVDEQNLPALPDLLKAVTAVGTRTYI